MLRWLKKNRVQSTEFEAHKQELLDVLARAFGCDPQSPELNPCPAQWDSWREEWSEGCRRHVPRVEIQEHLFTPRLMRPALQADVAETMDRVEAIFLQYKLCDYWDNLSANRPDLGFEHYMRCHAAVSALRAQIAPHYMHALREAGASKDDAVRIVGAAIRGYVDVTNKPVPPGKIGGPGRIISDVVEHARSTKNHAIQENER